MYFDRGRSESIERIVVGGKHMLSEQDTRAVKAMVQCNMELDDLCTMFPMFDRTEIETVMKAVAEEKIGVCADMHSISGRIDVK